MSVKRLFMAVLGIISVLALGACGGFKPTATSQGANSGPAAPVDGKAVFEKQCAVCHGAGGTGGIGPAFAKESGSQLLTVFPDASQQIELVTKGSAAFPGGYGATNKKGTGAMPGFANILKPEEIEAVVNYERSLAGG